MTILSVYWVSDEKSHERLFLGMLDTQLGNGYANHPRYGGYPWAQTCQMHQSPTLFAAIESLWISERLARMHPAGITNFEVIDEDTGGLGPHRPLPVIPFLLPDAERHGLGAGPGLGHFQPLPGDEQLAEWMDEELRSRLPSASDSLAAEGEVKEAMLHVLARVRRVLEARGVEMAGKALVEAHFKGLSLSSAASINRVCRELAKRHMDGNVSMDGDAGAESRPSHARKSGARSSRGGAGRGDREVARQA